MGSFPVTESVALLSRKAPGQVGDYPMMETVMCFNGLQWILSAVSFGKSGPRSR